MTICCALNNKNRRTLVNYIMNPDKPVIIGERRLAVTSLIMDCILLPVCVGLIILNPCIVWLWVLFSLFIVVLIYGVVRYCRVKKNRAIGTTIVFDNEGITIEQEEKESRFFEWQHVESVKATIQQESFRSFLFSYHIKLDNSVKPYEVSFRYYSGEGPAQLNLKKLKQRIAYFSNNKVTLEYDKRSYIRSVMLSIP